MTSGDLDVSEPLQTDRDGRLDTPLGPDRLVLRRFTGVEGISELFEFQVEALSSQRNIDFDLLLGRNACVTIRSFQGAKRYFNGLVTEGQWIGQEGRHHAYRLVLRPWTWMLGRRSTSRIFKQKTALDIVKEVFREAGFSDYEDKVNASDLVKLEYCVQYRESDLTFVSRLMEEWGIYTFFEHTSDKHKLVLANQRSSHVKIDPANGGGPAGEAVRAGTRLLEAASGMRIPAGSFPYISRGQRSGIDFQHLHDWSSTRRFRTGKVALNDFDYMKPGANLLTTQASSEKYEKSRLEGYHHPGRYTETGAGDTLARIRLESEQAADRRKFCSGPSISLVPGGLFDLSGHDTDSAQYLVIHATHSFAQQSYASGASGGGEPYEGHFTVMKHDRQYRAPLATPRPLIAGPQTAIVTDEKDEKSKWIDVDKEGRILVQFHWNRDKGTSKQLMSRRVRVAQMWSGKEWGWQVIPRVGQEVVVTFLEGDPDQPLVVGTVYNADYKYPYALPDNMTISGVKTECEEGQPGYNELIFEDKKNAENIRMHAQRLHEITVRQKETRTIGVANKDSEIARQTSIEHGHDSLTLKHGDQVTLLKLGDQTTKLELGDQNTMLELGDQNVDVAKNINIKANMGITITCGQSKITMTPASIKIESVMVSVEAQAMTQIKGSAMVTVKGGLVMIN